MPAWLCFIMDLSRRAILNHNQTRTGGCSDRVEENVLLLLPEVDRFWKRHILWNRRKEKKGARTGSNYSNKTCRPEGVVLVADWEKVFLFFFYALFILYQHIPFCRRHCCCCHSFH